MARSDGAYFVADWVGGCIFIAGLSSVILIIRGLFRQWTALTVGLLASLWIYFLLTPMNVDQWGTAEAATVKTLVSTRAPSTPESCNIEDASFSDGFAVPHLLQVVAVRSDQGTCSGVEVFDGWMRVAEFNLPPKVTINRSEKVFGPTTADMYFFPGKAMSDSWVVVSTSDGNIVGFNAMNPKLQWDAPGPLFLPKILDYSAGNPDLTVPRTGYSGNTFMIVRALGTRGQYIEGINPRTGLTMWKSGCPTADRFVFDLSLPDYRTDGKAGFTCYKGDGITGTDSYVIDDKGVVAPFK